MTGFQFLHAADLHLDSPLRGLPEDAPRAGIQTASRRAVSALVDLAIAQRVAFVVLAGDLFDGDQQDWRAARFLGEQLLRLHRASIPVVAISGNHDAESVLTRRLSWPPGCRLLPTDAPASHALPALGVSIHGQGFRAREVIENLALGYPPPVPGAFNIGLLHTAMQGADGHAPYAPCTAADLSALGYDYWALGHVHARRVVQSDPCWIIYPGVLQGRHVNEDGPKGATLITVRDGHIVRADEHHLDCVRWARIAVDLTGVEDETDVLARMRTAFERLDPGGERLLCARVTLTGATGLHAALLADADRWREETASRLREVLGDRAWLESARIATMRPTRRSDPPGAVARLLAAIDKTDTVELGGALSDYAAKLTRGLLRDLPDDDPARRAAAGAIDPALLARARALLAELG